MLVDKHHDGWVNPWAINTTTAKVCQPSERLYPTSKKKFTLVMLNEQILRDEAKEKKENKHRREKSNSTSPSSPLYGNEKSIDKTSARRSSISPPPSPVAGNSDVTARRRHGRLAPLTGNADNGKKTRPYPLYISNSGRGHDQMR